MDIIPITKYRVGSSEFSTREEAYQFIMNQNDKDEILKTNWANLNDCGQMYTYVPCLDYSDKSLRLFIKRYNNYDQGDGWEDILGREHLKYVEGLLQVIDSQRFIDKFIEEAENYSIYAQDLGQLIAGLNFHIKLLQGANFVQVYKLVLDALARVQYSPVYIND